MLHGRFRGQSLRLNYVISRSFMVCSFFLLQWANLPVTMHTLSSMRLNRMV